MAEASQAELDLSRTDGRAAVECKGMRSTQDFPADPSRLSREQIEHHYLAMRNSHASLSRSRGQFLRRSRESNLDRQQLLATLRSYEERLLLIGQEKAEAMAMAKEMHAEIDALEGKQKAMDQLLNDLEDTKQEAGFWTILRINELIERMRLLLRGGARR